MKDNKKKDLFAFVDRESFIHATYTQMQRLVNHSEHFFVFSIYGMGGIGKSRLLRKLNDDVIARYSNDILRVQISMEVYRNDDLLHTLKQIRMQVDDCFYLFEYALMKYWSVTRLEVLDESFMEIVNTDFRDLWEDSVDILGSIPVFPFTYLSLLNIIPKAISIHNAVLRRAGRTLFAEKEKIEQIDNYAREEPQKLYQLLPYYLAVDMNRILTEQKKRLVFICDSYVNQNSLAFAWLSIIIQTLSQGVFIITSREKLPWPSNLPVGEYLLDELPHNAAKELIHNSGITDTTAVRNILRASECIPIYLALILNSFKLGESANLEELPLFTTKADIVKYFFSHLEQNEQEVVVTLALVRMFTRDIFEFLIKDLNLQCTVYDYDNLCDYRINPYIEETDGIVKMHDVLANNMLKITSKYNGDVFERYVCFLSTRGVCIYNEHQLLILAQNAYRLVTSQENATMKTIEWLLDLLLYLYENGSWQGIQRLLMDTDVTSPYPITAVQNFLLGLIERRTMKLQDGYYHLCKAEEESSTLGKHVKSLLVHKYYVLSLKGDYNTAYLAFGQLYHQLTVREMREYYYGKIVVAYADLLMLRGEFRDTIKILLDLRNSAGSSMSSGVYIEVIRALAHCYRHNRLFTQSLKYYNEISHLAKESYFHQASYYTYLCEIYCYSDPERAIYYYKEGIATCRQLKAQSNLGKMYYAVGIAYLLMGRFKESIKYIRKSISHNKNTGYKSGVFFALLALTYWEYSVYGEILSDTKNRVLGLQTEIGVYDYLLLPIYIMENDHAQLHEMKTRHDWVDFSETNGSMRRFVDRLESIYLGT